jgi:putative NADPH-quinone reductase/1,4-dihydroxy-2-naphthoate octaprenyltransferase
MNVLVINGHPRNDSLSESLVNAYIEGAKAAGVTVNYLKLAELSFNLHVITESPRDQHFENDITRAQQLVAAADHLVFVYPTWWGTMPALLKGFLDRVLTPGFAFEHIEGGTGYAPLLNGKSAQVITTMDSPKWVYRFIYRAPGHNAMRRATLEFCGIKPVRILSFSSVRKSTPAQRAQWIEQMKTEGLSLKKGPVSGWQQFKIKTMAWLKAMRLQFYPMTFIAYTAGAYAARSLGHSFDPLIFWMGYLFLFFVEAATVLSNEYYDYRSDTQNKFFSPFTGGSRVLVEKQLSFNEIKKGTVLSLFLAGIVAVGLCMQVNGALLNSFLACSVTSTLALGYTVPPLRLSYRGLGEFNVAFTHSFAVIICGFIFQGGDANDPIPWLLSIPLFLSVLPSIILAGIPDHDADKAADKKTLAVRLGKTGGAKLAITFTIVSALTVLFFKELNILPGVFGNLVYIIIPHSILLGMLILGYIRSQPLPKRIDWLMIASLTYILWFALLPLIKLM